MIVSVCQVKSSDQAISQQHLKLFNKQIDVLNYFPGFPWTGDATIATSTYLYGLHKRYRIVHK